MSRRSVLFTCANANQVANAVPVAQHLLSQGVACRFLLLDPAYQQNAVPAFQQSSLGNSVPWIAAPSRALLRPFARMSIGQRWRAVWDASRDMEAVCGDHGALILGMDGAFERLILRRYRERGRFAAILWDGLIAGRPPIAKALRQFGTPGKLLWNLRRWAHFTGRSTAMRVAGLAGLDPFVPGLAGHSVVDRMYVMGDFVATAFRSQGVRTPVEALGIPRFAGLSVARPQMSFRSREIVYLTGSFLWHDEFALHASQQRDLDDLASWLPAAGWRLRIRLHPREDPAHYTRLRHREGVVLSDSSVMPLWDELARADVVVTAMSTAALESLALGRPIAVYLRHFPPALVDTTLGVHPQVPVARNRTELLEILERISGEQNMHAIRSVLKDFISPSTADSPALIANSIMSHLREPAS